MEDEEHVQRKLDLEFRKILRIIKPYIPCIMNNDYLFSYRMWLEKLSDADGSEKLERNNYLQELCKQIQDGVLETPFNELPTIGPLVPFESIRVAEEEKQAQAKHEIICSVLDCEAQEAISEASKQILQKPIRVMVEKTGGEDISHQMKLERTLLHQQILPAKEAKLNLSSGEPMTLSHTRQIPHQKPHKPSSHKSEGDASWSDLTDLCSTISKMGSVLGVPSTPCNESLDSKEESPNQTYETKISNLMNTIVQLQQQNRSLDQNFKCQKAENMKSVAANTSMNNVVEEVEPLKKRLKDITKLKDKQTLVTVEWQNSITELNKKLHFVQTQNSCLKTEILNLERKLQNLNNEKNNDLNCLREELRHMHSKEIENLTQHHHSHLQNMESRFNRAQLDKDNEVSKQMNSLKNSYELKMAELSKEHEETVQQKNQEIQKLESMIENQCQRMHEEVRQIKSQMEENMYGNTNDSNVDKIVHLQKCITRMDKLYKKTEKEYTKQIHKLKREIGIRDKSLQLHLVSQKAERLSTTNSSRDQEMDEAIVNLEERYRKLLEKQQFYFLAEKEQDTKLINELKAMIRKSSVDYT